MQTSISPRDPRTQSKTEIEGYPQTFQRWPAQPLVKRPLTLSELTGPQEVMKRLAPVRADLAGEGAKRAIGQLMHLNVKVLDEDGSPVPGAVVELWHCNAAGKYLHHNDQSSSPPDPNFHGSARVVAGENGGVTLRSIKPAAYPVPDSGKWWRPPHIHFSVWGRVWLSRLVTQMFFPDDPLNERDRILMAVPDAEARRRCVARMLPPEQGPVDALVYEYEIVVRGRKATPSLP
jgi:protocatechuate 3,4-dioxygenase beta subunit